MILNTAQRPLKLRFQLYDNERKEELSALEKAIGKEVLVCSVYHKAIPGEDGGFDCTDHTSCRSYSMILERVTPEGLTGILTRDARFGEHFQDSGPESRRGSTHYQPFSTLRSARNEYETLEESEIVHVNCNGEALLEHRPMNFVEFPACKRSKCRHPCKDDNSYFKFKP
ncbi:hypothetical protein JW711_03970 [Candidatus Woesearchaeota archaeon]|nr:hypothetical protein [Candidatus Woesearchaeota archaeon]